MDEARAMLDALMGPSRNEAARDDKRAPDFADEKVCKNFLVGFCPHDWFTASRRKMPSCSKIHSDLLREKFEAHPKVEKYRQEFEEQFLAFLDSVTRECDFYIGREKIKCRPKGSGGVTTRMPPDVQEKYDALHLEHAKLVKAAEEKADESLSKSEELTRDALEVEKEIESLKTRYRFEFPGEEVCDVCGVRYAQQGEDNPDWHDKASHLNGKMHHGWTKIRQKLKELREKERMWERKKYKEEQEKEKDNSRKRSRSRSRDHRELARSQDREKRKDRAEREKEREKEKEKQKQQERQKEREKAKEKKLKEGAKEGTKEKQKQGNEKGKKKRKVASSSENSKARRKSSSMQKSKKQRSNSSDHNKKRQVSKKKASSSSSN